ncbi:MAG: NmrA family NAD(P)-binding protein [Anaerolineales bacterium]|nr:NmrA family NAD(P)-binding protein [Anaerolineales bacterium]
MILVTGAAGKTGLAVIGRLSGSQHRVRALVYKKEYTRAVRRAGASEVVIGDLRDRDVVDEALGGVQAVYHIPPNVDRDEFPIGAALIEAARAQGVDRFVYHSVLHPHVEAMPHHWQKMRVEEYLFTSGLAFTILQPAAYMQNILGQWDSIESEGIFRMPYPPDTRISLVDLQDVARAAEIVLTRKGHRGAIYELAGTPPLSQFDVAALLSTILGREIRADRISIKSWEQNAREAGLDAYAVETLIKMFRYYRAYGFEGNPSVLMWLLGRPPTGFEEAIKRELAL